MATVSQLFRAQGNGYFADLVDRSAASFNQTDWDHWNGGTTIWELHLEVPVSLFASIEPRLEEIEKTILGKLSYLDRIHRSDRLSQVTITPMAPDDFAAGQHLAPPEHDVRRVWPENRFRLFLSHVAKHKVEISKLKAELADLGVTGFLAHEDIEPTREWKDDIALALKSMDALVALFTDDFHSSDWTDQEIGWALGRGVLIVSVRLGADPYGFVAAPQATTGTLTDPKSLAVEIVEVLLANPRTHHEMRRAIVFAMRDASLFAVAKSLKRFIPKITDFADDEKTILWAACTENYQVANAFGVPGAIYEAIGQPPALPETQEEAPPLSDDDIPF